MNVLNSKYISNQLKSNTSFNTIGFFDSGIGGISVLNELRKINPYVNSIYLGDNANFPYGNKSHNELIPLIESNISFLLSKNVSAIGIACNTATAVIFKESPDILKLNRIYNPISSVTKYINDNTKIKNVLIIGSQYTTSSKIYESFIKHNKNLNIIESSEQLLIEYIEKSKKGEINTEILRIKKYLLDMNIDTLVLGCTHYAHIKDIFKKLLDPNLLILDPSEIMAIDISKSLDMKGEGKEEIVFTKDMNKI